MNPVAALDSLLQGHGPVLALAPMQDVTDLPFWKLMQAHGGPDVYYTEYFRVHPDSRLERHILEAVDGNTTGRPAIAQMIGNHIPSLVRTARELQQRNVAAIDLNLGCPAPVVYRKCAGGGLLRDLERIDAILGALREAVTIRFTIKTRLGFDSAADFSRLLRLFAKHAPDMVVVHGRTVKEMYRGSVAYDRIAEAASTLSCPVLANGNVTGSTGAADILRQTGARGLMIGRGAIRNPWIFTQIRDHLAGRQVVLPTGRDVLGYIRALHEAVGRPDLPEAPQVHKLKKYLNYLGAGVDPEHRFLYHIRRCTDLGTFFRICRDHLDHGRTMPLEPFPVPEPALP